MGKGYIRAVTLEDADLILKWRNQDFVRNNMYNNSIIDYETHIKWFNRMLNDETFKYFIYEKDSIPIGVISFYGINYETKKASWAFYLGSEKARGAGVDMEQLALNYAFNELGLHKLYCEVLSFNTSVIEFHKKFGFSIEGIRRKDYLRDGIYYDIYQLALFKDEYDEFMQSSESKLPKTYQAEVSLDKINIAVILERIFDVFSNYPGINYKLLDFKLECQKYEIANSAIAIKCKLILQSKNKLKVEYFVEQENDQILSLEAMFEKTA